jgi:hypothetical protein
MHNLESTARFSASAKSERYNRGIISVGLVEGMKDCEWAVVDDVGELGGTDNGEPPQGEIGDIGSIEGIFE